MKKFGKMAGKALIFCAVMMLLCSFAYPLALTGASQLTMKEKANGNLIDKEGNPTTDCEEAVGSALIGQEFTEELQNGEYGGVSSGSYNYGNSNPELEKRIQKDLDEFLEEHPGLKAEDVPSDLLTASGSGLDPHISPKAAEIQIPYVAENSGLSEEEVTKIVEENTEHKVLGVFGEERVNVLKCNLAVANAMGILE